MSSIDKIMGAIGRHGDDCIRDADAASEPFDGLREMIAAALADAERKGAEQMRAQCLTRCDALEDAARRQYKPALGGNCDPHHQGRSDGAAEVGASIRDLPLPTGERQAVRLTDAAIAEAFLSRCPAHLRGEHDVRDMQARQDVMVMGRAVETAVLAANGLEVRRGS